MWVKFKSISSLRNIKIWQKTIKLIILQMSKHFVWKNISQSIMYYIIKHNNFFVWLIIIILKFIFLVLSFNKKIMFLFSLPLFFSTNPPLFLIISYLILFFFFQPFPLFLFLSSQPNHFVHFKKLFF